MNSNNNLIMYLGGIAIAWYFVCIFYVGLASTSSPISGNPGQPATLPSSAMAATTPPANFYEFMRYSITTLAGTLATFVGMVLGLRQVNTKSVAQGAALPPAATLTKRQWFAMWSYIFSLLLGLFLWWYRGISCDPSIIHLGQSLLGVIGGALAVLLNVQ